MVSKLVMCGTKSIFYKSYEPSRVVVNKDLSLFLLKKKFFLYKDFVSKDFKTKRDRLVTKNLPNFGHYTGHNLDSNTVLKSITERLRSKMA